MTTRAENTSSMPRLRLQPAIARIHGVDALAFDLRGDRTFKHVDHLEFGLVEMVLFIATVFVAYAYVWRRGGLEWD